MSWRPEWTDRAVKEAARLDRKTRERIIAAVERLAATEQGDVKRLTNVRPPEWRLRVGDWRIIFAFLAESRTLQMRHVRPRGSAYRD